MNWEASNRTYFFRFDPKLIIINYRIEFGSKVKMDVNGVKPGERWMDEGMNVEE